MSTKISGFDAHPAPVGASRAVERPRDATAGTRNPAGQQSGDVHITGAAARLAMLEQALREMPAIDESRVAAIRLSLEEGRYAISAECIADGLTRLEQSLRPLTSEEG